MAADYESRFEMMKADMLAIVAAAAEHFGVEVVEETEDRGYSFGVDRADGLIVGVVLAITDSEEAAAPGGNFVVRMDDTEMSTSWGPDNYTRACWSEYGDDESWQGKLDEVRVHFAEVIENVTAWRAKADPSWLGL